MGSGMKRGCALLGEATFVSQLMLEATWACSLEATERKGPVGPGEVSGADFAGVRGRWSVRRLSAGAHIRRLSAAFSQACWAAADLGGKPCRKVVRGELGPGCGPSRRDSASP